MPSLYVYIARLIRMYPFTRHIVSYIKKWPEECERCYQDPFLVEIANEIVADEVGHDLLILRDLQDFKIPVELAIHEFRSDSVAKRVNAFKESVAGEPIHLLAWLFHAEKLAVQKVGRTDIERFKKILGPFSTAIRFWRIHSSIGPEVDHVAKRKKWIQALSPEHKQLIEKELVKLQRLFSNQTFDLDFSKFESFINLHAPHLYKTAYRERLSAMDRLPF